MKVRVLDGNFIKIVAAIAMLIDHIGLLFFSDVVSFRVIGRISMPLFAMIFAVPAGLIVINLHKAGAFDYILDDAKILAEGILSLRN